MNISQKIWHAVCLSIILHSHLGAANLSPRVLLHTAALNRHTSLSPYPDSPATPPDSQPTSARSHTDDTLAPDSARVPSKDSPYISPSSTPPNPSPQTVSLLKCTRDSEEELGSLTPDRSEQLKKMAYVEQLELEALSLSSGSSTTSAEPSPSLSTTSASSPFASQHPSPLKSKPTSPEFRRMVRNTYHEHVYKSPSPEETSLWQKYQQQRESKGGLFPKSPSTSDIPSHVKSVTALSIARGTSGPSSPNPTSH